MTIMNKNATIHARIDEEIKEKAEKILNIIGIKPSEAINLFYKQVVLQRGIPFKVEIPNSVTLEALKELENENDLESFDSVNELFTILKD
jgi:DNA-damage-inducible protein J